MRNAKPVACGLTAVFACLALPGCAGEGEPALDEPEIVARSASLLAPRPGRYRTVTTLTEFALPGAAPQMTGKMRERLAAIERQVGLSCLGAEEARGGFLALARTMQEGDCRFVRFDAGHTRLRARLRCSSPGGGRSDVVLSGRAGALSSRMDVRVEQRGAAIPGGVQRMAFRIVNQRIGTCASG